MSKRVFLFWLCLLIFPAYTLADSPTRSQLKQKSRDLLINKLEMRLKTNPSDLKTRVRLGRLQHKSALYQKVISNLGPYADELNTPELLLVASAFKETRQTLEEIKILELVAKKNTKNYEPLYLLGNAYLELKEKATSERALRRSELKRNRQYQDKAIGYYRMAIKIAPKVRAPYDALLKIFRENESHYESQQLVTVMIKIFGPKGEFYSDLCRLYSVQAFFEQSEKSCKKAIKKQPEVPQNYVYLANTYYDQNKNEKTLSILKSALKKFPNSVDVNLALAKNYLHQKNYHAASRFFKTVQNSDTKNEAAILGLAESLFQIKDFNGALANYSAACKLDRSHKQKFRVALGYLKKNSEYKWVDRYQSAITSCP